MTTKPKHRAFTAEDVRAAYKAGHVDSNRYRTASAAHTWHTHAHANWHPDNPANRIAGFEWRTDAPEAGALIQRRGALGCMVLDMAHAEEIMRAAERQPETHAWRYVDPPTTTSEDTE